MFNAEAEPDKVVTAAALIVAVVLLSRVLNAEASIELSEIVIE